MRDPPANPSTTQTRQIDTAQTTPKNGRRSSPRHRVLTLHYQVDYLLAHEAPGSQPDKFSAQPVMSRVWLPAPLWVTGWTIQSLAFPGAREMSWRNDPPDGSNTFFKPLGY